VDQINGRIKGSPPLIEWPAKEIPEPSDDPVKLGDEPRPCLSSDLGEPG
jgi:hypothetical protein